MVSHERLAHSQDDGQDLLILDAVVSSGHRCRNHPARFANVRERHVNDNASRKVSATVVDQYRHLSQRVQIEKPVGWRKRDDFDFFSFHSVLPRQHANDSRKRGAIDIVQLHLEVLS
jgi:hypothetical protein